MCISAHVTCCWCSTDLVIYVNDQDMTLKFQQDGNNFSVVQGDMVLIRTNETLRISFTGGK